MSEKGFVDYVSFGNSRQYFPLISKADYFSKHVRGLIRKFFDNSSAQFASFFTQEANLSQSELEELRKIVEEQIKIKKDD